MKQSTRKHLVQRLAPFVLLLTILFGSPARAQQPPAPSTLPDPPVALTKEQIAVFQDALRALAIQGHVAIVAEGTPLRSKLPSRDVPRLDEHWPLSAVVERIAAAYDYDAQRRGNLFVLKKRFSDPNDLPNVTPEECRLALEDVSMVMSGLDPGAPQMGPGRKYPLIASLVASLTPEQTQALQSKAPDTGLAIASLNAEQQAMVRRMALTNYVFYPAYDIKNIATRLRQAPTLTLRVKKEKHQTTVTKVEDGRTVTQNYAQNTVFGYELVNSLGRKSFVPFDSSASIPNPNSSRSRGASEPEPKPQSSPEGFTTLRDVIDILDARGANMKMDAALQEKPVTIFGNDAVPPTEILKSLADIYGLRIRMEQSGIQHLTRPLVTVPLNIVGLPESVRHVLPEPILRAMHDGEAEELGHRNKRPSKTDPASTQEFEKWWQRQQQIQRRADVLRMLPQGLHQIAVDRLRLAMEAQLASQGTTVQTQLARGEFTQPVLLSSLSQTARSAFATAMMTEVLEILIHTLGRQAPDYVANTDHLYLTGSFNPDPDHSGKWLVTIGFARPQDDELIGTGMFILGAACDP